MNVRRSRWMGGFAALALAMGMVAASSAQASPPPDSNLNGSCGEVTGRIDGPLYVLSWCGVFTTPHDAYRAGVFAASDVGLTTPLLQEGDGSFGGLQQAWFTGITVGQSYVGAVRAIDGGVPGPWIPSVNTAKAVARPPAVRLLKAKPASSSAVITWAPPLVTAATGPLFGYEIYVSPGFEPIDYIDMTPAWVRYDRLTNLKNGVRYTFRIRAMSGNATGHAWGPAAYVVFRPIGTPARPLSIAVTKKASGKAKISWSAKTSTGYPVAGYKVYVNSKLRATIAGFAHNSVTLGGFKNGNTYTYSVKTYNASGTSKALSKTIKRR